MKKIKLKIIVFIFCLGAISWGAYHFSPLFYPGLTSSQAAKILIDDPYFGGRALITANLYGDKMLEPLKKVSNNFTKLDSHNSFWLSEFFCKNNTPATHALLNDLYDRKENHYARLVASIALAAHGLLPDEITPDSYLVKVIKRELPEHVRHKKSYTSEGYDELAIIALGKSRDPKVLPFLFDSITKRPSPPPFTAGRKVYACRAIAEIGHKEGIPVLRDCLQKTDFYVKREAFEALIALSDRLAVPLAIEEIDKINDDFERGELISALESVTKKRYGSNVQKWRDWWQSVENEWQIPD